MPFEQIVPPIFPSYERDIGWPLHTVSIDLGAAVGAGGKKSGYDNAAGSGTSLVDFSQLITAMLDATFERHRGVVCAAFSAAGFSSGYWWGNPIMITGPFNDDALGAFPCAVLPGAPYRVYIDDVYVAFETPVTLSASSKPLIYVPTEAAVEPALAGVSNDQYGIRADGAGGFEFFSAIAGAETEAVALVWPTADLSDFVKITAEHQIATQNGAGQLRLFLNDNLVLTRSFSLATMPSLVDGTTPTNSAFMRRAIISSVDGPDTDIFATMFRCRAGRFTVDGTEIL